MIRRNTYRTGDGCCSGTGYVMTRGNKQESDMFYHSPVGTNFEILYVKHIHWQLADVGQMSWSSFINISPSVLHFLCWSLSRKFKKLNATEIKHGCGMERYTRHACYAGNGKRNATVWRPSLRLSSVHLFRWHTYRDSPGGSMRMMRCGQRTFQPDNKEDRHTCN